MNERYRRMKDGILLVLIGVLVLQVALFLSGGEAQGTLRDFVPLVVNNADAQVVPPLVLDVPVPDGIRAHFTNPGAIRDSQGVIFAATRSGVNGGMVWKVRPGQAPEPVLVLDLERSYGNGELQVWKATRTEPEMLMYIAIPCDSSSGLAPCPEPRRFVAYQVEGYTP